MKYNAHIPLFPLKNSLRMTTLNVLSTQKGEEAQNLLILASSSIRKKKRAREFPQDLSYVFFA